MATLSGDDRLKAMPEDAAGRDNEVLRHILPLLVDNILQGSHIPVISSTGSAFHVPPHTVVKRIEIWTLRRLDDGFARPKMVKKMQ